MKPTVMSVLDDNQYGAIENTSTTRALISVLHTWSLGTDGNRATVTTLGTLRFATARCCYGYEKSNLLPVTSAHALQYGFPAVACFSTTAK